MIPLLNQAFAIDVSRLVILSGCLSFLVQCIAWCLPLVGRRDSSTKYYFLFSIVYYFFLVIAWHRGPRSVFSIAELFFAFPFAAALAIPFCIKVIPLQDRHHRFVSWLFACVGLALFLLNFLTLSNDALTAHTGRIAYAANMLGFGALYYLQKPSLKISSTITFVFCSLLTALSLTKWSFLTIFLYVVLVIFIKLPRARVWALLSAATAALVLCGLVATIFKDSVAKRLGYADFSHYVDQRLMRKNYDADDYKLFGVISDGGRFYWWQYRFAQLREAPYFGLGLGLRVDKELADHNFAVFYFSRFGIIGGGIMLAMYSLCLYSLARSRWLWYSRSQKLLLCCYFAYILQIFSVGEAYADASLLVLLYGILGILLYPSSVGVPLRGVRDDEARPWSAVSGSTLG